MKIVVSTRLSSFKLVPKTSAFKMAGGQRRDKAAKNCGIFCHVTHDELAFSEVISSDMQSCPFSGNLNPLLKRNKDILSRFT